MRILWYIQRFFHKPGQWISFTLIYLAVFYISVRSLLVVADEYEGGNWLAELGSALFYYFEFPVFTIWSWNGGFYDSRYDNLVWILMILNLFINYLLTAILLSWLLNRLKR